MSSVNEASQQANRTGLDPRRLVVIFLLLAGMVMAMFMGHVLERLWVAVGWRDPELLEGLGWKLTAILGVVSATALTVSVYVVPRSHQLAMEISTELMKVRWPAWDEVRVSTVAVVVASLIAAIILFGMDLLSKSVMHEWLPKVWEKL